MEKPTIGNTEAIYQAGSTVQVYFNKAIELVEEKFGKDSSKKYPELIATLVNAQVSDFNNCALTNVLWEINDSLWRISISLENN